jgi:hypothetical protein
MRSAVAILTVSAACNQLLDIPEVHRDACDFDAPFTRFNPVGGIESELGEQSAQLSGDELTLVFSRRTIAGSPAEQVSRFGDLYMAQREHPGDDFHSVTALDELNTNADEASASLSGDQLRLYFDRRDSSARYQIFMASRPARTERFDAPTPITLGDGNGSNIEPFITSGAIAFASKQSDGSAHLFTADGRGTSFAAPRQLASLEILPSPAAYENPVMSFDGLTIYFSAPPDNASPPDIWRASRAAPDQPFGPPHVIAEFDTISSDRPTWISEDSCRLYFITNRTGRGFSLWLASRSPR